ncbi:site-specific integrase [Deinococcus fonticola]|uniref:site-specific integrase n=1 Tax=Deinococcus fonticola TaxID=2528713 RepID=UPI00107527F6|nr:site-specific integrase [Deinococcus fonticola]
MSDVSGKVRVGSPKTAGSRRTVYLSPSILDLLRREQHRQAELRIIHGPKWQESGRVFVNSLGGTLLPNNLKRDMQRIYTAAGVRHLHIHGLRDTYASLAARQGVPIEVISKQLGHASVAFTLNVYRTVFQDERQRWAIDVDDLTKEPEKK